jgi:hypothetical protein
MIKRTPLLAVVAAVVLSTPSLFSQELVAVALDRIYQEYDAQAKRPDAARLVLLDQELRRLVPHWSWDGAFASSKGFRPIYESIGVTPALFEPELLSYSGKLLLEAHRRDPKVRRSRTLYATVFGEDGEAANALPSLDAGRAYLREFPTGPFAVHVHLALANFYADLFKVVQRELAGEPRDYKYDCFRAHLNGSSLITQRRLAQEESVRHLVVLVRIRPEVRMFAEWLANMQSGRSEGWHYCAD